MAGPNVAIVNVQPTPGSFNILRNQTFTFTIQSTFQVNPAHTYVVLDNKPAIIGGVPDLVNFIITVTPHGDGYDYSIQPTYLFKDRAYFNLEVNTTDIFGTPAPTLYANYIIIDTRPPLVTPIYPLDGYTDVPIDLTIHFLVNQLSVPNVGLIPSTLTVYVDEVPAIINGNIQSPFDGIYSEINFPSSSDITTPFEILLDYAGRFPKNNITIVSVSCDSIVLPIVGTGNIFLDQYGSNIDFQVFTINTISNVSNSIEHVTINLDADGYISDGYQLKDADGNIFRIIDIIDGYQFNVEVLPNTFRGKYTFITAEFDVELVAPVFAGYFQGVYLVDNLGDGYHINVTWHPARTTRPDYDLAYLIYYSTMRSDVFYEGPKLITQGRRLPPPETIPGADAQLFGFFAEIPLPVGVSYYFGVRATEFPHSAMPVVPPDGYDSLSSGLVAVDGYSFIIPESQILMTQIVGNGAISIPVTSTTGYARAGGYITVGTEIMRYSSLITIILSGPRAVPGFAISPQGRGLFGTNIQNTHNIGEFIRMYYGNNDDNTVIAKNLVSWEQPHDPHRTRPDLVTTDFTLEDGYHAGFEFFDYCGYHRFRPDELLDDSDNCGTYVGGEYNGHRGLFIFDRMLANEEQLLETTGEPAILLRRLWSGETCICRTSRKDSSKVRSCAICFGTGFKIGFVQYRNPRRDDQRVMVHFSPTDEEIGMGPQSAWDQKFAPGTWTIAVPAIKDRDVLIRFNEFNEIDWIYIVSAVSRAKSMFGRYARQRLKLNRLDKTDIMYQFKIMK